MKGEHGSSNPWPPILVFGEFLKARQMRAFSSPKVQRDWQSYSLGREFSEVSDRNQENSGFLETRTGDLRIYCTVVVAVSFSLKCPIRRACNLFPPTIVNSSALVLNLTDEDSPATRFHGSKLSISNRQGPGLTLAPRSAAKAAPVDRTTPFLGARFQFHLGRLLPE